MLTIALGLDYKTEPFFSSGSIGLDGMTVIAAPTAVRGTGSIPSHRLVPLMEDVNTVGEYHGL